MYSPYLCVYNILIGSYQTYWVADCVFHLAINYEDTWEILTQSDFNNGVKNVDNPLLLDQYMGILMHPSSTYQECQPIKIVIILMMPYSYMILYSLQTIFISHLIFMINSSEQSRNSRG